MRICLCKRIIDVFVILIGAANDTVPMARLHSRRCDAEKPNSGFSHWRSRRVGYVLEGRGHAAAVISGIRGVRAVLHEGRSFAHRCDQGGASRLASGSQSSGPSGHVRAESVASRASFRFLLADRCRDRRRYAGEDDVMASVAAARRRLSAVRSRIRTRRQSA